MASLFKYPYGREKDKPINECNKGSLKFYVKNLKLGNPKFDMQNIALAKECLLYLKAEDIMDIIGEIPADHPAHQMCCDSVNAINDKAGVFKKPATPRRELPVIQLEPKSQKDIIDEVKAFIEDLYKKAAALQRLLDEHTDSGIITRDDQHLPF